jgi:hypothetical protein
MALVQFSGALVPKLSEKPRLLPTSPAVARASYADSRILALQNGYVCGTVEIWFDLVVLLKKIHDGTCGLFQTMCCYCLLLHVFIYPSLERFSLFHV